ncbi:MAG: PLP-dependent aminotransferase family protein [Oscillospiraceae bacterium]|jgi:DNA-binding transcriptional MocR family regulator|nr:PLP-dependent aminotransferase family protein [Oscillospiraceae bacterium]
MPAFAARYNGITGSAIREIFKIIAQPGVISFAGGNPAAEALEDARIADLAREALSADGKRVLQYGGSEGWPQLKEEASRFLAERGVNAPPDALLPVSGTTQTIDLLCKALIDPGDTILVENPSFLGAFQTMRLYQARLSPIETDGQGAIPGALEEAIRQTHPKLVYLIPTFQNPTGVTMPVERRKAIAELAERYDIYILEDDPYRDLRYSGAELPPIHSFDRSGRVLYLASFSKLISPGLRVGVVTAPPELLRKLVIGKQSTDLHTDQLSQAIVARYLAHGYLPGHLADIRALYGERLERMLAGLDRIGLERTAPEGGLFVWCSLPEGGDARALLERAVSRKVAFVPGAHFYCDGGHNETLRLNFSNSAPDAIDRGLAALAEVI